MSSISLVTGNTCLPGYTYISSWPSCRAALSAYSSSLAPDDTGSAIFGYDFVDTETEQNWPKGCYHCDDVNGCWDGAWYNNHDTGSANAGAELICGKVDDFEPTVKEQILFIGDSDVDYWTGVENNDDFVDANTKKFNVGIGGYTCQDVKDEVEPFLDVFDPSKVVLVCGENDLFVRSVAETFQLFREVVQSYIDGGVETVFAFSTKPEPSTTWLHYKYRKLDQLIVEWIQTDDQIDGRFVFIDTYNGFEDLGNPDNLYRGDRLHLSRKGYGYWEAWLAIAMEQNSPLCRMWRSGDCIIPGAGNQCIDDPDWTYNDNPNFDCDWVAEKPFTRCERKEGAQEACECTCIW